MAETFVCSVCGTNGIGDQANLADSGWHIVGGEKIYCPFCRVTQVPYRIPLYPLSSEEVTKKIVVATNFHS